MFFNPISTYRKLSCLNNSFRHWCSFFGLGLACCVHPAVIYLCYLFTVLATCPDLKRLWAAYNIKQKEDWIVTNKRKSSETKSTTKRKSKIKSKIDKTYSKTGQSWSITYSEQSKLWFSQTSKIVSKIVVHHEM